MASNAAESEQIEAEDKAIAKSQKAKESHN